MVDETAVNNENTPLVNSSDTKSYNILLDPREPYLKWIAVFFMCFLSFGIMNKLNKILFIISFVLGSYYCYDNPAGLQDVMKDDLKISSATFTAFYSWYSWPNVV